MSKHTTKRACLSGKRAYATRAEAKAAIRAVRARRNRPGGKRVEQSVYHCLSCGAWHLTSKP